jgi:hypothetical protein
MQIANDQVISGMGGTGPIKAGGIERGVVADTTPAGTFAPTKEDGGGVDSPPRVGDHGIEADQLHEHRLEKIAAEIGELESRVGARFDDAEDEICGMRAVIEELKGGSGCECYCDSVKSDLEEMIMNTRMELERTIDWIREISARIE